MEPQSLRAFFESTFFIVVIAISAFGAILAYTFYISKWARRKLWETRNSSKIKRMEDHFILCGFGRVGAKIADELHAEGVGFIVIDKVDHSARAREKGFAWLQGNPAKEEDALKSAGIAKAKGLIIAVGDDADALYIAVAAKSLRDDLFIISRASSQEGADKLTKVGVKRVALPYAIGGYHMAAMALRPAVVDFLDVVVDSTRPEIVVDEFKINAKSELVGKTIAQGLAPNAQGVAVLAVRRPDGIALTNPRGETVLQLRDTIILMGTKKQIETLERTYLKRAH